MGEIIVKSSTDVAFRQRLLADPAATLRSEGVELPVGMSVRAVEGTDTLFHLVLPTRPAGDEALSEQELEAVAGGGKDCHPALGGSQCDPRGPPPKMAKGGGIPGPKSRPWRALRSGSGQAFTTRVTQRSAVSRDGPISSLLA